MAENILFCIFCFPAIIGLAEIIHFLKLLIISGKDFKDKTLVIVPTNDNFKKIILKTVEKIRWYGNGYADRVVILDYLLSEENKKECEMFTRNLDFIVCSKTEFEEIFF